MPKSVHTRGFTLIELLVVVSIIGMLIGILMPVMAGVRQSAERVSCASNLRQIGLVLQSHRTDHKEHLPAARYMPPPLLSADTDPGLPEAMRDYLPYDDGKTSAVWACPDDDIVYDLCGTSYDYSSIFSGQRPQDVIFIRMGFATESEIIISRDFDNASADVDTSQDPVNIPARHLRRNNLWLDGRVEVIQIEGADDDG